MTHIQVRDAIGYSYERATAELEHYMNRRRHGNGDITASLRLDLAELGLAGVPAVVHSVHMQFEAGHNESGPYYNVSWHPVPEGPYPLFSGTMRLAPDDRDPRTTFLEVAGAYQPPLGALGAAFDLVIGRRIAAATLRAFVADISRGISPESSSESRR